MSETIIVKSTVPNGTPDKTEKGSMARAESVEFNSNKSW